MLGLLQNVWNAIRSVPYLIADLVVASFNAIIVGIAALAAVVMSLLPGFPDAPGAPSGIIGTLAWIVPLGAMVSGFALLVTAWTLFLVVRIALKWVKAL